ncbi:hypothetical protein GGE65_007841 [Skermanella aerolata]|uniref:hypothetical protein n=1 Tax=Skermanella aerolata TaxID=393310 RepID=UPI003D1EF02E
MKGSEYLAGRAAIAAAGLVTGGAVIVLTALCVVPWMIRGLEALAPGLLPPLGGALAGLAAVMAVAASMTRILACCLLRFEAWVIDRGGIDD